MSATEIYGKRKNKVDWTTPYLYTFTNIHMFVSENSCTNPLDTVVSLFSKQYYHR